MGAFLEQFAALKKTVPIPTLIVQSNHDVEFCDYTSFSKNCRYCFSVQDLQDSAYSELSHGRELIDCDRVIFSELSYEVVRGTNMYRSTYCTTSHNCSDCHFSYDLVDCKDCFGCVGLTKKQNCIFNQQYSPEEYAAKIEELRREEPDAILRRVEELLKKVPQPATHQFKNENCDYGDFVNESQNVYWGFDVYGAQNCGYIFSVGFATDSWDCTSTGGASQIQRDELCYEMCGTGGNYHSAFLERSQNNRYVYYSSYMRNSEECLGCVGLMNKKYCILNKQLTKEEYFATKAKILGELGWAQASDKNELTVE
jgi:hypothetical protein